MIHTGIFSALWRQRIVGIPWRIGDNRDTLDLTLPTIIGRSRRQRIPIAVIDKLLSNSDRLEAPWLDFAATGIEPILVKTASVVAALQYKKPAQAAQIYPFPCPKETVAAIALPEK